MIILINKNNILLTNFIMDDFIKQLQIASLLNNDKNDDLLNNLLVSNLITGNSNAVEEIIKHKQLKNILNNNYDNDNFSLSYPLIYSTKDLNTKSTVIGYNNNLYMIKGSYPKLNNDETFKKEVLKYYRNKFINDWIYSDAKPLLNYFKIVDGKVKFIEGLQEYDTDAYKTDSIENFELKVQYLKDEILTKSLIKHIIKNFVEKNGINWYDLKQYNHKIETVFYNYLDQKFLDYIKHK